MDKQEFDAYINLHIKLQERCKHIAEVLSEYDSDFSKSRFNTWVLNYDQHAEDELNCYTEIPIYTRGCNIDSKSISFPVCLLYSSDNQINQYAREKYKK